MVWYFIGVYITNRTLHGRLEIQNFSSSGEKLFHSFAALTREIFFNTWRENSKRNFLYLCCFKKNNYLIYPWYMDWLAHHLSDTWFNKWYLLSFCHTKELLKVFTVPQRWLGYQALQSLQLFTINMTSYVTIYQGAKKVSFTACPNS